MVGARWEHHRVIANLDRGIDNHIRARGMPCRTFRETFWLKDKRQDLAVFPDIIVHCGALMPGQTSVDDPVVLVEVISRGSGFRDRLEKRAAYEKLPPLAHIVLVATDHYDVEVLTREADGSWTSRRAEGPASAFALPGLDFAMPLAEVYRDVLDPAG
jgi:Uma2 family endonuclease